MLLFYLFVLCFGATVEYNYHDLSQVVHTTIGDEQEGATEVAAPPPWMARVYVWGACDPILMCSAVCVKPHIFITATRCLTMIRVPFTHVGYQETILRAKAFVHHPSFNRTLELHNNISFIITVLYKSSPTNWQPIRIIVKRSWDEYYVDRANVVGYVRTPGDILRGTYKLYELPVQVNTEVCREALFPLGPSWHKWPPCYTCIEHTQDNQNCQKFLRGLGHAVVQKQGNEDALLGITTWGILDQKPRFVGFAVPTAEFYQNMDCAEKIEAAGRAWTYDGELDLKAKH